jgi:hypothetical protein
MKKHNKTCMAIPTSPFVGGVLRGFMVLPPVFASTPASGAAITFTFSKEMSDFIISFFPDGLQELLWRMAGIISSEFDVWASEHDAGVFFVSSELSAEEILEVLSSEVELPLTASLFVFQFSGSWAGFTNTTCRQALSERHKVP